MLNRVLPFPMSPSVGYDSAGMLGKVHRLRTQANSGRLPPPAVSEFHLFKPQLPDNPGANKPLGVK